MEQPREQGPGQLLLADDRSSCAHYHINLDAPVRSIPEEKLKKILYGTKGEEVKVQVPGRNGRKL
jgi:excinuclease UvrABC ATPase subunit